MNVMPDSVQRHSRLGIASFIIALSVGVLVLIIILVSIAAAAIIHPRDLSATLPVAIAVGLGVILAYCGNLVGLGLGIAGARQCDRKRIFAVIGLCLNAIGALVGTLFFLVGLALHPAPTHHESDDAKMKVPNRTAHATSEPARDAASSAHDD